MDIVFYHCIIIFHHEQTTKRNWLLSKMPHQPDTFWIWSVLHLEQPSKAISEALAVLGFLWTLSLLLILLTVLFLVLLQKTISNTHYEVSSSDAFHG